MRQPLDVWSEADAACQVQRGVHAQAAVLRQRVDEAREGRGDDMP